MEYLLFEKVAQVLGFDLKVAADFKPSLFLFFNEAV